jgi:hypothetical protein
LPSVPQLPSLTGEKRVNGPNWELEGDIEEIVDARRTAMRLVHEHGDDPLNGLLLSLEHLAEPFYLGLDEDQDGTDLDVFP